MDWLQRTQLLAQHLPGMGLSQAQGVLDKYNSYATLADQDAAQAEGRAVALDAHELQAGGALYTHAVADDADAGRTGAIHARFFGRDSTAGRTSEAGGALSLSPDELARIVREACDERLAPMMRKLDEALARAPQ